MFGSKNAQIQKTLDWERFRKPGEWFRYIGVKMTVVRTGIPAGEEEPKLFCRYVDYNGEIHHYSFAYYELPILKKMNDE
jgi:hypothetical protein